MRAMRADGNRSISTRSTCCVPSPRWRITTPPQRSHFVRGSSACWQ
jgi:hypothetical protein